MPGKDTDQMRRMMAEATGNDLDPLAEASELMKNIPFNPFDMFISDVIEKKNLSKSRENNITRAISEWIEFMDGKNRQASCPTEQNVWDFIYYLREKNAVDTVKVKLRAINNGYEFLQQEPSTPHPTTYNPFTKVLNNWNPDSSGENDYPAIELDEIRDCLPEHYRDRVIVFCGIKLGLRRSEINNIKIADINIANDELSRHYPEIGDNVEYENAIIIPHDRDGNKSSRTRVLPLDDEMRKEMLRWLLIRPKVDEPWLLLSKKRYVKLSDDTCSIVWNENFSELNQEGYRDISSHYGRHYFSTYWTIKKDWNTELVGYMRGDSRGESVEGTLSYYLHSYYEDIEDPYRKDIFKIER